MSLDKPKPLKISLEPASTLSFLQIKTLKFELELTLSLSAKFGSSSLAPGTYLLRTKNSAPGLRARAQTHPNHVRHNPRSLVLDASVSNILVVLAWSFPHQLNSATYRADNLSMNFSKRDIPCVNYRMHTMHCMRNIGLCQICDEPIPRKDLESHQQSW